MTNSYLWASVITEKDIKYFQQTVPHVKYLDSKKEKYEIKSLDQTKTKNQLGKQIL